MILPQSQCLYVIENKELPRFKIGITSNVDLRFRTIRNMSGCEIELAWVYPPMVNAIQIEQRIHEVLAKHRGIGEWFNCDFDEIMKAIDMVIKENIQRYCPVADKYLSGYKVNEIAKEFNVSRTAIVKHLKERNLYKSAVKHGFVPFEWIEDDVENDTAISKAKLEEMVRRSQEKRAQKKKPYLLQ